MKKLAFGAYICAVVCALVMSSVSMAFANGSGAGRPGDSVSKTLRGLPDPESILAKPLVVGRVQDPKTGEAAAGALVTLEAWPSSEDLAKLVPGDIVPTTTIAKAQVRADGTYELKVGRSRGAKQFVSSDHRLNADVIVHTLSDHPIVSTMTVEVNPDGVDGMEPLPVAGPATVNLDAADVATPTDVQNATDGKERVRYNATYWVYQKSLGTTDAQIEHVGAKYDIPWASWTVTNKSGSSSTLGAATTVSGLGVGKWSTSGTTSVSSSETATWSGYHSTATATASYKYYLTSEYGLYRLWEYSTTGIFPDRATSRYESRAMRLSGNSVEVYSTLPSASKCNSYSSGIAFKSMNATTFSQGVNLGGMSRAAGVGINFSVSSKSGRTSSQSVAFKKDSAHQATRYQVCGVTNFPDQDNPGALVAKKA